MFRRFFLSIFHWSYLHLAKPILFLSAPDDVHATMINFANHMSKFPPCRGLFRFLFRRKDSVYLSQNISGIDFPNPVGLAAGFDKNGEIIPMIESFGFGYEVVGSVTARPCSGNPKPWFYRLPKSKSAVVNAGLANDGSIAILARVKRWPERLFKQFPLVLSVAKTNSPKVKTVEDSIDDYIKTIKRATEAKAIKAVELNISCPNSFDGEDFSADPKLLDKLLLAVDELNISLPIYLKMPHGLAWSDFSKLLEVAVRHGVDGVAVANLVKDRLHADLKDELPDGIKGNLSGLPTQALSDELVRLTYLHYGDKLKIIGVGGIFSGEDAYRKIRLGASLVQIATGAIFEGPQLAAEINEDLIKFLKRDGFQNISEAVGVDARK